MDEKKPYSKIEQITLPLLVGVNLMFCFIISLFNVDSSTVYIILLFSSVVLSVLIHPDSAEKLKFKIVLYFVNASVIFTSTIGSAQLGKQSKNIIASWYNQDKIAKEYALHSSVISNPTYLPQIQTTLKIVQSQEDLEKYSEVLKFLKKHPEFIGKAVIFETKSMKISPDIKEKDDRKVHDIEIDNDLQERK